MRRSHSDLRAFWPIEAITMHDNSDDNAQWCVRVGAIKEAGGYRWGRMEFLSAIVGIVIVDKTNKTNEERTRKMSLRNKENRMKSSRNAFMTCAIHDASIDKHSLALWPDQSEK